MAKQTIKIKRGDGEITIVKDDGVTKDAGVKGANTSPVAGFGLEDLQSLLGDSPVQVTGRGETPFSMMTATPQRILEESQNPELTPARAMMMRLAGRGAEATQAGAEVIQGAGGAFADTARSAGAATNQFLTQPQGDQPLGSGAPVDDKLANLRSDSEALDIEDTIQGELNTGEPTSTQDVTAAAEQLAESGDPQAIAPAASQGALNNVQTQQTAQTQRQDAFDFLATAQDLRDELRQERTQILNQLLSRVEANYAQQQEVVKTMQVGALIAGFSAAIAGNPNATLIASQGYADALSSQAALNESYLRSTSEIIAAGLESDSMDQALEVLAATQVDTGTVLDEQEQRLDIEKKQEDLVDQRSARDSVEPRTPGEVERRSSEVREFFLSKTKVTEAEGLRIQALERSADAEERQFAQDLLLEAIVRESTEQGGVLGFFTDDTPTVVKQSLIALVRDSSTIKQGGVEAPITSRTISRLRTAMDASGQREVLAEALLNAIDSGNTDLIDDEVAIILSSGR